MKHLLLISLLLTGALWADFKVGDHLPPITLKDQFEKEFKVEPADTLLILAFEKDISVTVTDYLKNKPSAFLADNHAKYISDISTMPSFITSMFALPKMKKYPFSVLLIRDNFGEQFDREQGKITVYKLKNNMVQSVQFITADDLPTLFPDK